jgi:VanZ family protein
MRYWTFLTLVFSAVLALIVALADRGGNLFHFVYAIPGADKTAHFLLMGTLAFLANMALAGRGWWLRRSWLPAGSVLVAILVTVEEASQHFIPTRTLSLLDLLADYAGILLLGGAALWWQHLRGGG